MLTGIEYANGFIVQVEFTVLCNNVSEKNSELYGYQLP